MKRLSFLLVLYLVLLNPLHAAPKSIWAFKSEIRPADLWHGKRNNLFATDVVSWENGGKAIIMFFNVDGNRWRCFDYFDIAMHYQSSACFQLKSED